MANTQISPAVYGDLLALANHLRTSGAITPTQAAQVVKGNARYGRELLGLLAQAGLGSESAATAEFSLDHWDTDAEFLAVFSGAFGGKPKGVKAPKASAPKSARKATAANTPCACGCGKGVNRGRQFLPGHDARMVSQLAAAVVGSSGWTKAEPKVPAFGQGWAEVVGDQDIQHRIDLAANLVERNFSSALGAKAHRAMMSGWDKAVKGSAPKAAPRKPGKAWKVHPAVKVGRWEYPARSDGRSIERNTKRDGSGEWVAV